MLDLIFQCDSIIELPGEGFTDDGEADLIRYTVRSSQITGLSRSARNIFGDVDASMEIFIRAEMIAEGDSNGLAETVTEIAQGSYITAPDGKRYAVRGSRPLRGIRGTLEGFRLALG